MHCIILPDKRRGLRIVASGVLFRCLFCCAIAVLVAACGLQKGHFHHSHRHHHHHKRTASSTTCAPSDIRTRLDVKSAGVAAGTLVIPLDFTNISAATCQLSGIPAVTLSAGRHGRPLGTAAIADPSARASSTAGVLLLQAGQTAHAWIHLADVANLPAARCRPVTAAGLRVTLPGAARATFIGHRMATCAKPVHGADILTIEPFQPGRAKPGTAQ
jgi:hypothetical protein